MTQWRYVAAPSWESEEGGVRHLLLITNPEEVIEPYDCDTGLGIDLNNVTYERALNIDYRIIPPIADWLDEHVGESNWSVDLGFASVQFPTKATAMMFLLRWA